MSKYRTYERQAPPRRKDPHPIWRGIGCFVMLFVPVFSYAISAVLIQAAPSIGIQLPASVLGRPSMPDILFKVPGLVGILNWIESIDNLYAILIGTFMVAIVLAGVVAFLYAIIYRIAGPPRYTELDVPTPNIKVKKYKR